MGIGGRVVIGAIGVIRGRVVIGAIGAIRTIGAIGGAVSLYYNGRTTVRPYKGLHGSNF
ncbi:hypothetical protein [Porphyromonas vaginalis]|uniref:hypothetical protein n=1 Tax=Porphyromonas vaginalis TaxID=3044325 RepID=UPI00261021F6|nr:hypothetical protein [Porphyromonas vaginalis]